MKTKILLLIACIFLTGCKIQKHTQLEAVSSSIEQKDIREDIKIESSIQKEESKQEEVKTKENIREDITEVRFSAPDSVGRQHVTIIINTVKTADLEQEKKITSLLDECFQKIIDDKSINISRNEGNSNIKQENEAKTKFQTDWIFGILLVITIIGIVALLACGIYLIRKFKK